MNIAIVALLLVNVVTTTVMIVTIFFLWKLVRIYLNEPAKGAYPEAESTFRKDTDVLEASILR